MSNQQHHHQPLLPPEATTILRDVFGFSKFRSYQQQIIARVLHGKSTLAILPTGAGKSLTYQLPAQLLPQATVVISPLIALMKDQLDRLPPALQQRATVINSTLSGHEMRERLRAIAAGTYKLVYIAPERLRQRSFLYALRRCGVARLVIDEAHCISLWGQHFRPDYLFIRRAITELGTPPVLAVTATAATDTINAIKTMLGPLDVIQAPIFRPNLFFQVVRIRSGMSRVRSVIELCQQINGPIIIYARARQRCEELACELRLAGIAADHYHALHPDREAVQERFMNGKTRVLVATVAFGMGVDKADIRAVIHYNLPPSLEAYYQEAGRAGRDGWPARCILFFSESDANTLRQWLQSTLITRPKLRELYRHIRKMIEYPVGVIDLNALQDQLGSDGETLVRVGISVLEQVGVLRRHFDLPLSAIVERRTANLHTPDWLRQFPQEAVEIDLVMLARQYNLPVPQIEAVLLEAQASGQLLYRPGLRLPLIECLPVPPDVGDRIDHWLATAQQWQERRIEAAVNYARQARCRHQLLAAYFGQQLTACRTSCDVCAPSHALSVGIRKRHG
ncbi:RecQ family ATP-dependent DNA helicase [Chloroflexus sp. MS-CIW-1]|jgi:ATP-dependent DNA helicase RecQ|uniref:RecQ family ATP-dependent DNA helicase n=1 Tax=unclassified Chloroflexus TaxID=2633855 RepID=UPI0004DEE6C7|nr:MULTISPECIES: RecQ family ATP-dependent DNA helicase [unclassified Chloroflexus]MDN5271555.1 RecQ family ATP-dependent DNA helicase [Chloroflexus sp. MS-CIW-1]